MVQELTLGSTLVLMWRQTVVGRPLMADSAHKLRPFLSTEPDVHASLPMHADGHFGTPPSPPYFIPKLLCNVTPGVPHSSSPLTLLSKLPWLCSLEGDRGDPGLPFPPAPAPGLFPSCCCCC
jgi:hypothetical protein